MSYQLTEILESLKTFAKILCKQVRKVTHLQYHNHKEMAKRCVYFAKSVHYLY